MFSSCLPTHCLQTEAEAEAKAADTRCKHLTKQLAEQRKALASKQKEVRGAWLTIGGNCGMHYHDDAGHPSCLCCRVCLTIHPTHPPTHPLITGLQAAQGLGEGACRGAAV